MSAGNAGMAGGGARQGIVNHAFKDKAALYSAYMPFLKAGGIFVPTPKRYFLGDEVFLLLTLLDDTQKLAIPGKVAWLTPAGANNNRNQGIGIEFAADETCKQARLKIESLLGGALNSTRPTHTM